MAGINHHWSVSVGAAVGPLEVTPPTCWDIFGFKLRHISPIGPDDPSKMHLSAQVDASAGSLLRPWPYI